MHLWPVIKVCGITSIEDANKALQHGANSIGLLIGPTHTSADRVDNETARSISTHVRKNYPDARIVMVTISITPDDVLKLAQDTGVNSIQIHEDMSVDGLRTLRGIAPDYEIIKALHITGTHPPLDNARAYAPYVDAFLTDTRIIKKDGSVRSGGTGIRHDPAAARALIAAFPDIPFILAGGLNPDTVEEAIRETAPAGIDAQSGLKGADGKKCAEKIKAYVQIGQKLLTR